VAADWHKLMPPTNTSVTETNVNEDYRSSFYKNENCSSKSEKHED